MIDKINAFLHDGRLDYLAYTIEYQTVRFRLSIIKQKLQDWKPLTERDTEYICGVETHLPNIEPHYEKMIIDGEEQSVFVITKRGDKCEYRATEQ